MALYCITNCKYAYRFSIWCFHWSVCTWFVEVLSAATAVRIKTSTGQQVNVMHS